VKLLDAAGVTLVPGTDAVAGFTLHREYELWVKAGIPPARVLHHATLGAARYLGWDRELGRIATGFSADVILVDGDPTEDISAIRRIAMTVKHGDVYFPAEIYRELGVKPFVEAPAVRLPAVAAAPSFGATRRSASPRRGEGPDKRSTRIRQRVRWARGRTPTRGRWPVLAAVAGTDSGAAARGTAQAT
jgi:hypothetical protein